MALSKYSQLKTPPIVNKPHQPSSFLFPKREFGKTNIVQRLFQAAWFKQWTWLHYSEDDAAFCFLCVKAYKENRQLWCKNFDPAFISTGFTNWKDASVKFRCHDTSNFHKEVVEKLITLPSCTIDVAESLSSAHKADKLLNRQLFMKILTNLQFLVRQSLPLRSDGDESDSNFIQLLMLRGLDDSRIKEWMQKKTNKHTSPEIQNELLQTMALHILTAIANNLQIAPFYTIIADETTDISNQEQLVVCMQWVDSELDVHEEFVGLQWLNQLEQTHCTEYSRMY